MKKLDRQPSARNVWNELETNTRYFDPNNKVIEEISTGEMEWYDTKDRKHIFKKSAPDTLLSRMRNNPPE